MSGFDQYEIVKSEFKNLVLCNVALERISEGHRWTEGPVWFPLHNMLLFSDIPNETIMAWTQESGVYVYRAASQFANGNTRDPLGRLVTCQHGTRSVSRTEHDGSIVTLADRFDGKSLNSPNDVVVQSDGSIWFTDPTYGIMTNYEGYRSKPEQDKNRVYRLSPDGSELSVATEMFAQPNGLAFSKDETTLYIAESGHSHDASVPTVLRAFDVDEQGGLSNGRDFATIHPGIPDGFRVDENDNIWCSAADGVHCLNPEGELLGKIKVPETVSNLTFGGRRGNQLFITATTSVYSIYLNSASA